MVDNNKINDFNMENEENKQEHHLDIEEEIKEEEAEKAEKAEEKSEKESEYLEMLQRLKAEFDNYRKRTEREKEELAQYVRGNVIRKLLTILDDFERLITSESDHQNIKHGAELIYNNLMSTLKEFGLEEFSDRGKPFDPNIHEAFSVMETDPENDGKIMETWQKGYWLNDKLLRPPKVIVGKGENDEKEGDE